MILSAAVRLSDRDRAAAVFVDRQHRDHKAAGAQLVKPEFVE